MSFSMKIEGMADLKRALKKMPKKAEAAVGAATWMGAQDIRRRSAPKVPVDTGTLRRAWVVSAPKKSGDVISVDVGYGTHYALYVHERTEVSHTVGEAKFLESAIKEESGQFLDKLARRAGKILESGGAGIQPREVAGPKYSGGVS